MITDFTDEEKCRAFPSDLCPSVQSVSEMPFGTQMITDFTDEEKAIQTL